LIFKLNQNKDFIIIVDSREQRPYEFEHSVTSGLPSGDYSILGYEYPSGDHSIAIERKSKSDAYGTIGRGRKRFIRELERLSKYDYAAILIESSLQDFLKVPKFSEMNPRSAINSLISWSIRYGVHVWFADNRILGKTLVYRILEKFYWNINKKG